jgi:hypothetical protein
MHFIEIKSMINRSLLSLNNQLLNGNVKKSLQIFGNLSQLKPRADEQLSTSKSQSFTSFHKSFIDEQFGNQNKRPDTISIYNTNASADPSNHALNENSTSVIDSLLNVLSNNEFIRVCKQIIVGGSVGALAGSLLGQTSQFFYAVYS